MKNWKEKYKDKVVTAEEAVTHIPNDCRILIGPAANQPPVLVNALCRNYQQYKNVELIHWVTLYDSPYCAPEMKGHLRFNACLLAAAIAKRSIAIWRILHLPILVSARAISVTEHFLWTPY